MKTTRSLWLVLFLLPTTLFSQFYADTLISSGPCNPIDLLLCPSGVDSAAYVVDNDPSNFATMKTNIGLVDTSYLEIGFTVPAQGGSFIGVHIQKEQALSAIVASTINMKMYDSGGNLVLQKSGMDLQDINLLSGTSNTYLISIFTPNGNYDIAKVRLEQIGLIGTLNKTNVYSAFYINQTINQSGYCGLEFADTVLDAGPAVPPGLLGGVADPVFAVDTIDNNFALMSIPIGILGSSYLELGFPTAGNAGDFVGFTIGRSNSLLGLNLLQNIDIEVLDAQGNVVASENNFDVTDLELLSIDTNRRTIGFYTPPGVYTFESVRFNLSGLIALLTDLRVFNAFRFNPVPPSINITASGPTDFCQGDSVILTADPGYTNYNWSNGSQSQSSTAYLPGAYYVTAIDPQGCAVVSAGVDVSFLPSPVPPTISVLGNTYLCNGDQVTLTSSQASNVVWSTTETTQSIVVSAAGDYFVTFNDPNFPCPGISDTITVDHTDIGLALNGPSVVCPSTPFNIAAVGGTAYVWNTGALTQSITATITQATVFSVVISDNQGCSDVVTLTVTPDPLGSIDAIDDTLFAEGCVPQSVTPVINDLGIGNVSFVGTPQHGTVSQSNNILVYTPEPNYNGPDFFTYVVCNATCQNSCDTGLVVINVTNNYCDTVIFPGGITPNNDGVGDRFVILGIDNYPDNHLYILNRWGDLIYEAQPYGNDWSGLANQGMTIGNFEVTDGTYYYVFLKNDDATPIKGFFELRKQ